MLISFLFLFKIASADVLDGKYGCFLVKDLESGAVVQQINSETCKERFYACSTFKVPLAVMGFESRILKDEHTLYKWDGAPQIVKSWEQDQTARSWLKNSVVWYSRRITPRLGLKKIRAYLKDFGYGNQDFSGGLTQAWLSSTLKISAEEQVEFLRRLAKKQLKVAPDAIDKTLSILPIERDEGDERVSGKTGSCFSWHDPSQKKVDPFRIGWYVGYFSKGAKRYVFALTFKDKSEIGKLVFAGFEAKKMALEALKF